MIGPKVLELVKLFANMPTEDFLDHLIKSKAAGASTVLLIIGIESGPEAVSKDPVSPSNVVDVGVSEVVVGKGKEKKRHRDGHYSKTSHSKKLKDSASCPVSGRLVLFSEDDAGTLIPQGAGVIASESIVGKGLRGCKSLADKVFPSLTPFFNIRYYCGIVGSAHMFLPF